LNTTFHICFAFLPQENASCYSWALLKGFYNDIDEPRAISIDRDLALINAIDNVFLSTKYIICTWNINGNIAKNLKVKFENGEAWKKFLEEWNAVMYANQAAEFEDNWRKIHLKTRCYQLFGKHMDIHERKFRLSLDKSVSSFGWAHFFKGGKFSCRSEILLDHLNR
jgi:hypothetical protein